MCLNVSNISISINQITEITEFCSFFGSRGVKLGCYFVFGYKIFSSKFQIRIDSFSSCTTFEQGYELSYRIIFFSDLSSKSLRYRRYFKESSTSRYGQEIPRHECHKHIMWWEVQHGAGAVGSKYMCRSERCVGLHVIFILNNNRN